MRQFDRIMSAVALLALSSCSGHMVMTPIDPAKLAQDYKKGIEINGMIVSLARNLVEVDALTQVNVSEAKGVASSTPALSSNCKRVAVRKFVSAGDWNHPYILHYEHGLLETYTFSATLNADGVLTSINSQSTPDQGKTLANLASSASAAAGIPRVAPAENAIVSPDVV